MLKLLQTDQRIYFLPEFLEQNFTKDYKIETIYNSHQLRFYSIRILFLEVLSRSPFFFNYLESQKLTFKDVFTEVHLLKNTSLGSVKILITKTMLKNKLYLYFPEILLEKIEKYTVQRAQQYNLVTNASEDTLQSLKHTFPIRKTETSSQNSFSKEFPILIEDTTSLDYILPDLEQFKELPKAFKQRIINFEFLKTKDNTSQKNNLQEFIQNLMRKNTTKFDTRITELNILISNTQKSLQNSLFKRQTIIQQKLGYLQTDLKFENLERVLTHKNIDYYTLDNTILRIYTKPLILNFNHNKLRILPNEYKKIKTAIKQGAELGIGRHLINLNLENLQLSWKPLDTPRNYHIEHYTCFGTFNNAVINAQETLNIPKLIALALQMLTQATIGDPAGNKTLASAYIINTNSLINYKNEQYPILEYLELINKEKHEKGDAYAN